MTNVNGINPAAIPPIQPTDAAAASPATAKPQAVGDSVEISDVAQLAAKVQELPEVRTELVQQVKSQIAAGEYETPERIELAIDRLMDEL